MTGTSRSHVFLVRDGKILVLQQAGGARWWGQPGGDVERDETPAQAVVRETREETGLVIVAPDLLRTWSYRDRRDERIDCYCYAAAAPPNEGVRLSDEHTGYAWLRVEDYAERYCGEQPGAVSPPWVQAFLAEIRKNCEMVSEWLREREAAR